MPNDIVDTSVKLRIVSDGSLTGTKVTDADTGEDYALKLGIQNIRWTHINGQRPFLSFDLCPDTKVEITTVWPPNRP